MSGDPVVLQAIANVRARYSRDAWEALQPRDITEQIYREIRRLDCLRVAEARKALEPAEAAA